MLIRGPIELNGDWIEAPPPTIDPLPSMQDASRNVTESIVIALKSVLDNMLPVIGEVHGFWAEFYYPNSSKQDGPHETDFYGNYSSDFGYPDTPDRRCRVIATGIMIERYQSEGQLDGYFGPPPIVFMPGNEQFPENTHIRIFLGEESYLDYQLDRHDYIYGLDNALITKLILVPIAAPK